MLRSTLAILAVSLPALAQEPPAQPEAKTAIAERAAVEAAEFMVSAAHPLAAQAGYDVLAAGGSAADAAVAVQGSRSSSRRARASAAAPSCSTGTRPKPR